MCERTCRTAELGRAVLSVLLPLAGLGRRRRRSIRPCLPARPGPTKAGQRSLLLRDHLILPACELPFVGWKTPEDLTAAVSERYGRRLPPTYSFYLRGSSPPRSCCALVLLAAAGMEAKRPAKKCNHSIGAMRSRISHTRLWGRAHLHATPRAHLFTVLQRQWPSTAQLRTCQCLPGS